MMKSVEFGKNYPVRVNTADFSMEICPDGAVYRSAAAAPCFTAGNGEKIAFVSARTIRSEHVKTGVGEGVRIFLADFPQAEDVSFELYIWQTDQTGELVFEFIPLEEEKGSVTSVQWPVPLVRMNEPDGFSVLPISQGMLLKDSCRDEIHPVTSARVFSRESTMPWWGQYRDHGYIAIIETPWDAKVNYHHLPEQQTQIAIEWIPTLGRMAGRRVLRLRFKTGCDYVTLAKEYRAYVMQNRGLVTLEQKMLHRPLVRRMIGTPVVNTDAVLMHWQPESRCYDPDHPEQNHVLHTFSELGEAVQALHDRGLQSGYFHIDGWGALGYDNLHPDILPPCEEAGGADGMRALLQKIHDLGYLSALHDQYRDYYTRAASFDEENAIRCTDGTYYCCNDWNGGDQRALCTTLAQDYVTRNYDRLEALDLKPDGAYLDVFSVIELDECDNPRHRMSRRECVEERCRCFANIRSRNMIISSEEPMDRFIDELDLVHHGPYIYAIYEVCGEQNSMIPVPLVNLVYHECVLTPWHLGVGGWGIPPKEYGVLHGLLNGGLPMLPFHPTDREMQLADVMSRLHRQVWNCEMLSHELLENGGQRTVFADGTTVTVNLQTTAYSIAWPGKETECGTVE